MVKKKAIFFDRDGTLIKTKITTDNKPVAIKIIDELVIFKSVKKILKNLKKNYLLFIITNQPDVARKTNIKKNVIKINSVLKKKLFITDILTCYCDDEKCQFRKPNTGMIIKSSKKYNLELKESYVIGDRWKDIDAGNKAGCKTIFIDKKYEEKINSKPNYRIKYFYELKKIFKI